MSAGSRIQKAVRVLLGGKKDSGSPETSSSEGAFEFRAGQVRRAELGGDLLKLREGSLKIQP